MRVIPVVMIVEDGCFDNHMNHCPHCKIEHDSPNTEGIQFRCRITGRIIPCELVNDDHTGKKRLVARYFPEWCPWPDSLTETQSWGAA